MCRGGAAWCVKSWRTPKTSWIKFDLSKIKLTSEPHPAFKKPGKNSWKKNCCNWITPPIAEIPSFMDSYPLYSLCLVSCTHAFAPIPTTCNTNICVYWWCLHQMVPLIVPKCSLFSMPYKVILSLENYEKDISIQSFFFLLLNSSSNAPPMKERFTLPHLCCHSFSPPPSGQLCTCHSQWRYWQTCNASWRRRTTIFFIWDMLMNTIAFRWNNPPIFSPLPLQNRSHALYKE